MSRWDDERRWSGGREPWGDEDRSRSFEERWRGREGGQGDWRRAEGWRGGEREDLRPGERRTYYGGRGQGREERDDRWRETAREQDSWRDRDWDRGEGWRASGWGGAGGREAGTRDYGRESGNRDYGREAGHRDFGNRDYGNRDFGREGGYEARRGPMSDFGTEYRRDRGEDRGGEHRGQWTGEERRPDTMRSSWGMGAGPGAMGGFGETAGYYGLGHAYDLSGRGYGGEPQRDRGGRGPSGEERYGRDYGRDREREGSWWDRVKDEGRRLMGHGEERMGKGPKGYRRSDERIHDDVCERIARSGMDADQVEVKVQSGEVTLTGNVPHRDMKRELEDIAEEVFGVTGVQNNIRVERGTQQPQTNLGAAAVSGAGAGSGTVGTMPNAGVSGTTTGTPPSSSQASPSGQPGQHGQPGAGRH